MEKYVDIDLVELSPLRPKGSPAIPAPELVVKIMRDGLVNAITVRSLPGSQPAHFELVEGEADWIAAQHARAQQIKVTIDDNLSDTDVAQLIKGDRRQSLAPRNHIDDAEAFGWLHSEAGVNKTELGEKFGITRPAVSQIMRLLSLDREVQEEVRTGRLSYTHARILAYKKLPAEAQRKLATTAIERGIGVKDFQALISGPKKRNPPANVVKLPAEKDQNIIHLEQALSELIGSRVEIEHDQDGGGDLKIRYDNLDILSGVLEKLGYQER